MPWCPKCKTEYVPGTKTCSDCGSELVEVLPDEESIVFEEECNLEDTKNDEPVKQITPAYVEKASQHEDMQSSGYSFLIVGAIALVIDLLFLTNIIQLNISSTMRIIYLIIFAGIGIAFLLIGLASMKSAKRLKGQISEEKEMNQTILDYFQEHFTAPDISQVPETEVFFVRNEAITNCLQEAFPELDESYQDYILEILYHDLFE